MRRSNLKGKKFGRLKVDKMIYIKNGHTYWKCKCDCGNDCIVKGYSLKSGNTKSCGCLQKENASKAKCKHRMSKTKLYKRWEDIKKRCYNKNSYNYKNYGGRGIKVCDEWLNDFMNFYNWAMENGYEENLSIDRIDNNGDYEPNNCRWVDIKTQCNNRRSNHLITYKGKTQNVSQWCEELNVSRSMVEFRLRKGLSLDEIFTKPSRIHKKKQII